MRSRDQEGDQGRLRLGGKDRRGDKGDREQAAQNGGSSKTAAARSPADLNAHAAIRRGGRR